MRVGIISQARMSSSRLPGKILRQVDGRPLIQWHLDRLKSANAEVMIATTTNGLDDLVEEQAEIAGVSVFRGSEHDVLARFAGAAEIAEYDAVVRVTSDCPLIPADVINSAVRIYRSLDDERAYVTNCLERTYPRGFDCEVFSSALLQEAHKNATQQSQREHVTPYFYDGSSQTNVHHLKRDQDGAERFRLTVDTILDRDFFVELARRDSLWLRDSNEIIQLLIENEDLAHINSTVRQKPPSEVDKRSCSQVAER